MHTEDNDDSLSITEDLASSTYLGKDQNVVPPAGKGNEQDFLSNMCNATHACRGKST